MIREHTLYNFSSFQIVGLFMAQDIGYLVESSMGFTNTYVMLLLGGVFCTYWLDPVGWHCCSPLPYPFWFVSSSLANCWPKSPTVIVELLVSLFSFLGFCSTCFETLLFGASAFRILMSSWWNDPFIIWQCSSLSLGSFFVLKSVLSF